MPAMTTAQIEKGLGVSRGTLHHWIAEGLLWAPVPRGPKTTYDETQVLRIQVIKALRGRKWGLSKIKTWLISASHEQLEALVRPPAPAPAQPPQAPEFVAMPGATAKWEHGVLVDGLELHMRLDAGPLVRRLAQEIFERYSLQVRQAAAQDSAARQGG